MKDPSFVQGGSREDEFLNDEYKMVQVSGRLRMVTAYSTHQGNSYGQTM